MANLYDASGAPLGMQYRTANTASSVWQTYWYERDLLNNIVAVYNHNGSKLVSYTYDAWGNFTTTYHNGGASTKAADNPFTYRGYYYDKDLNLYYLGTRYYDSKICRFINADSALYHNMLGYNLFAYCNNNPINYYDPTGTAGLLIVLGYGGVALLKAIAATVATFAAIVAADMAGEALAEATSKDKDKDSPQAVQPPATSEDAKEVDDKKTEADEKDSRFYGKPGEIKREGYKETYIGESGKAQKERHWSNHGNPKKHSNPHDHDISWDVNGNPDFTTRTNYWDGDIPIFP